MFLYRLLIIAHRFKKKGEKKAKSCAVVVMIYVLQ